VRNADAKKIVAIKQTVRTKRIITYTSSVRESNTLFADCGTQREADRILYFLWNLFVAKRVGGKVHDLRAFARLATM
jgi:hypothetical protein